jgi:hypothetical protein
MECKLWRVQLTNARVERMTHICKWIPGLIKELYFVLFRIKIFCLRPYLIGNCALHLQMKSTCCEWILFNGMLPVGTGLCTAILPLDVIASTRLQTSIYVFCQEEYVCVVLYDIFQRCLLITIAFH